LFGALIREMGAIARGDCVLSTLRQSLALAMPRAWLPVRLVMQGFAFLYRSFLAAPAAIVADAHAALHRGMHHLIQFIDLTRGGTPRLTTRANGPQLVAASKEIFDRLEQEEAGSRFLFTPTGRNRLLWLSRFFHAPLGARFGRRALGLAAAFAVAATLTYGAVRAAVQYHPVYIDRMQKEARDVRTETR
jgi:hypothetical protein